MISRPAGYDLLGRIRTEMIYPPFLERLNALLNACVARGQVYVATAGHRTYAEQDALYARGRTAPGARVTNARGGRSQHNFGIAVDLCPHGGEFFDGKLSPDYAARRYLILGEECERLGLEWGGTWKSIVDRPHVQLPIVDRGVTLELLRDAHRGGISNVFTLLDTFAPWFK